MHDPPRVGILKTGGDLARDVDHIFQGQGPALDALAQIFALGQFHDQEAVVVVLFDAVDARYVGMVQRRQRAGFLFETGHAHGISGEHCRQQLDRHVAAQFCIEGAIDLSHAAGAEVGGHFIVGQGLADHRASPCWMDVQLGIGGV